MLKAQKSKFSIRKKNISKVTVNSLHFERYKANDKKK